MVTNTVITPTQATKPVLPDWTRWSWRSVSEREWFYPQFQAASNAYHEIEREAVAQNLRPAAYQFVAKDKLVEASKWAHSRGLLCVPYTITASTEGYSATSKNVTNDFSYRVLIVNPNYYKLAYPNNNQELGELLGYPECCRQAFEKTWGQGQVDSTWEQTNDGKNADGWFGASTLFRWMGLRLVSHMPCTYQCEHSKTIAHNNYSLGRALGFADEMETIREVLSWPTLWSRLFGIAEIVTPALKISTRSDWTPTKEQFYRKGAYTRVTKARWEQNGFKSAASMRAAHKDVIVALKETLPKDAHVYDLGCGNGELMRRLTIHRPDLTVGGVDVNEEAIKVAGRNFLTSRIQEMLWIARNPTAVLINPARLLEMGTHEAEDVREWLTNGHIPQVFVYNYDGKDLRELCLAYRLPTPEPLIKTPHVELGMWQRSTK